MADVVFASLRLGGALARLGQASSFTFGARNFDDFAKKGIPKGWGTPEEPVIASVAGDLIFLYVPDEVVALFCEGVKKRGQIHAVHKRYEGKNVAMVELGTCEKVLLYTDLLTVMYEAGFLFFTALDLSKELDCETLFFRKVFFSLYLSFPFLPPFLLSSSLPLTRHLNIKQRWQTQKKNFQGDWCVCQCISVSEVVQTQTHCGSMSWLAIASQNCSLKSLRRFWSQI